MHLWLFPMRHFLPQTHTRSAPRYPSLPAGAAESPTIWTLQDALPTCRVLPYPIFTLGTWKLGAGETAPTSQKSCAHSWHCPFPSFFPSPPPQLSSSTSSPFCLSSPFISKVQFWAFHSLNPLNHEVVWQSFIFPTHIHPISFPFFYLAFHFEKIQPLFLILPPIVFQCISSLH